VPYDGHVLKAEGQHMKLNRSQRHDAIFLFARWSNMGVAKVLTGAQAANLAYEKLGRIPAGLVRTRHNHDVEISLARVAAYVARNK